MPKPASKTTVFEIKGTTQQESGSKSFTKTIRAFSEQNARERTMALFGSKNKIKRRNITILEVKPVKGA